MERRIIRRFRRELRERGDIAAESHVILDDDPTRRGNTVAATELLHAAFNGRVKVSLGPGGITCGSREEQATRTLQEYTRGTQHEVVLLGSLPASDLAAVLAATGHVELEVHVPDEPESRLLLGLADRFGDVIHGP